MSRYRIIERVGDHYERVETYADLERHHPSAARQPGREYATLDGRLEEVRHLDDGRVLVKKDFILLRDPAGPVYVPAPVSGYIHHLNDPTNAIRIYDQPSGSDGARLLAQSLHMQHGTSPPQGSWIDYGMPLGRMGDVGSPGSVHVHLEAEAAQYRRYIHDISAGNITPERHPPPEVLPGLHGGASALDVRQVQQALNQLGHRDPQGRTLAVDGIAGPRTAHAVRAFQQQQRVEADGIAGPATVAALSVALRELPLRDLALVSGTLRQGAKGPPVEALQSVLGRLGYEPPGRLAIDGHFGPATARSVEAFQRAHGLQSDRIVGSRTQAALANSLQQPLISERTHPQHPLYLQAVAGLEQLQAAEGAGFGIPRDVAVSLALAAHRGGLERIDQVALGTGGERLFAVQAAPGDPVQRHASVELQSVSLQPTAAALEAMALQSTPIALEAPVRQRALRP